MVEEPEKVFYFGNLYRPNPAKILLDIYRMVLRACELVGTAASEIFTFCESLDGVVRGAIYSRVEATRDG